MTTFNEGWMQARYLPAANLGQPDPDGRSSEDDMDLSMFTNTQFFDFDIGVTTDFQPPHLKPAVASATTVSPMTNVPTIATTTRASLYPDMPFDYMMGPPQPLATFPISPAAATPVRGIGFPQPCATPASIPSIPQVAGRKRTASEGFPSMTPDELSRAAAEEDKRRRNTAASARFRHKKKQREQEMERKAKEAEELIARQEDQIKALTAENKWLRSMILEKSGNDDLGKTLEELHARRKDDKSALQYAPASELPVEDDVGS